VHTRGGCRHAWFGNEPTRGPIQSRQGAVPVAAVRAVSIDPVEPSPEPWINCPKPRTFRSGRRRPILSWVPRSEAPHDADGLLFAVTPGKRYVLGGAARHIGSVRRCDHRWKSMGPIPGHIIGGGVTDIAGGRWRRIHQGLATRCPVVVVVVPYERPERRCIPSAVMPERLGDRRMRHRMRRSKPSTRRSGCLVRGKHKRYCAERRDKRPIHSIRHGTHQFVGY
jgi:hypothetical protein